MASPPSFLLRFGALAVTLALLVGVPARPELGAQHGETVSTGDGARTCLVAGVKVEIRRAQAPSPRGLGGLAPACSFGTPRVLPRPAAERVPEEAHRVVSRVRRRIPRMDSGDPPRGRGASVLA